jgi:histidine ammonia-lyase
MITLGSSGLTMQQVVEVARGEAKIEIAKEALEKMAATRAHIESLAASETPVYGISTGFGALANRHIAPEDRVQLQKSLIRSHAAGMGDPVEKEVVRALMLLRLKTLVSGRTGVRPELATTYAELLNSGITPIVHEYGSLGCSGDLAPLAHCALVLMGEGRATGPDGIEKPVTELLAAAGITPIELREKEGLALINGTDGMLGMLILALHDLNKLVDQADLIAAMSVEGLMGTDQVFRAELHEPLRPHPGQAKSAANMFDALKGSEIVASHREGDDRVQDAYSLRCAPQVAGAVRDTITHASLVATRELAATVDNPVVLESGEVTSNGNFHGAPVGYVLDFLAIAATDLSSISERRTDRFLDKFRSHGLNPFLAEDAGVDSGLMIAQYTQAGLVLKTKDSRFRQALTQFLRRRCRRITSRWAGTREESFARWSITCAGYSQLSS